MPIFKSHWPSVDIPNVTITDLLFGNISSNDGRKVVYIDVLNGRQVTLWELNSLAKKVGKGLHNNGFRKGDIAAIFLPNSVMYPAIFHGILMTGGVVTTANPTYIAEELKKQLLDSTPSFLFTLPDLLDKAVEAVKGLRTQIIVTTLPPSGAAVTAKYISFDKFIDNDGELPQISINPSDLAVLPYSSGTTGLPKGVMIDHRAMVANMHQIIVPDAPSILGHTVFSAFLPFFHVYGLVYFMHVSLFLRVPCVVFPRFDLQQFLEAVQKYKITHSNLVPPVVLLLAKHPMVDNYDLSSLRLLNSGAAPLGPELQQAVLKRIKIPVRQGYGMSETPTATSVTPYFPGVIVKPGSSGMLLPNVELKVISPETKQEVGVNDEGELCFRCPNMMKGYYKRGEIDNIIDREGFLHTGDVGYIDADGYLFIVDRIKELIKYNGFQVAPAELEAVILQHHKVMDAAVVAKPDISAGDLPYAFVVLKPNEKCSASEISEYVASHVSNYKQLRGGVEFVDLIPKSASGKILRRLLRDKLKADESRLSAKL